MLLDNIVIICALLEGGISGITLATLLNVWAELYSSWLLLLVAAGQFCVIKLDLPVNHKS